MNMVSNIRKCFSCNVYTLKAVCDACGKETGTPHPPRFSPDDRFGKYRRQLRELSKGKEC